VEHTTDAPQPGLRESTGWAFCLLGGYVALALLPLLLAYLLSPPGGEFLEEVAKGAGMLAFSVLALQVVLSARFRWVDPPFGHDVITRFHKGMAILALGLLVAHPLLLAAEHGLGLLSFDVHWAVNLGKATLLLLLLVVFFALFFQKLGIEYQLWRYAHKGAPVVIVMGFIHSYAIGDALESPGMQVYWWILLGTVAAIVLYRNAYIPLWGRRSFRVVSVEPETHDTYTIAMEPEDGRPIPHRPGQFMFLRLHRPGRRGEEHPFTISSSPTTELPLTATIKESGDFTDTIGQTREGDTAGIEAPYGRFSFLHHDPESFFLSPAAWE
jgi:predicted ferric reductase